LACKVTAIYEDGVLRPQSPLELLERSRVEIAIYQVDSSADCPAHRDQVNQALGRFFGAISQPPVVAALPRRLCNFQFRRGAQAFMEMVDQAYSQSSPRGLEVFIGAGNSLKQALRPSSR
jgi:hypothetical protein